MKLKELVLTLREKLDGGESKFETGRVYQEDKRFYEIRRGISGDKVTLIGERGGGTTSASSRRVSNRPAKFKSSTDDEVEESREEFAPLPSGPVKFEKDAFDVDPPSPSSLFALPPSVDDAPDDTSDPNSNDDSLPPPKRSRKQQEHDEHEQDDSYSTSSGRPRRKRKLKQVVEEDDDDDNKDEDKSDEDFNPSSSEEDDSCTCKFCGKTLSNPRNLKLHTMNLHTGVPQELTSSCPICSKPFPRRCSYKRHLWSHFSQADRELAISRGEKPPAQLLPNRFQCELCPYTSSSPHALTRHQESHTSKEERQQLCPLCGISVINMKKHMRVVHECHKKYSCTICNKKFKLPSGLKSHKVVHFKEKPWKCEYCPREFGFEVRLKEHVNSHLGIRPFPCQKCQAAFTTKGMLQRHSKTYHEEGSRPGRPSYVRGPEKIKLEERRSWKKDETKG